MDVLLRLGALPAYAGPVKSPTLIDTGFRLDTCHTCVVTDDPHSFENGFSHYWILTVLYCIVLYAVFTTDLGPFLVFLPLLFIEIYPLSA